MKNCIIKIGNSQALSKAVQEVLFGMGARWYDGRQTFLQEPAEHGERSALAVDNCRIVWGKLELIMSSYPNCPIFYARTEFGELIDYLSKPEEVEFKLKEAPRFNVVATKEGVGIPVGLWLGEESLKLPWANIEQMLSMKDKITKSQTNM